MNDIFFHIGAHKTATTYMQSRLFKNAKKIKDNGTYYINLGNMRNRFTPGVKEGDSFLTHLLESREQYRLLLSDENMAGGVDDIVLYGHQYVHAPEKMAEYARVLNCEDPVIFLAMREYSSFLSSMYCEYLRHNAFIPFNRFQEINKRSGFNWYDLVAELLRNLPKARIVLWDFGKFRSVENLVFKTMTGFTADELEQTDDNVRESFSELVVQCIENLSSILDLQTMRKLLPALAQTFPKGETYRAFNPIDPTEEAEERLRYARDIERIVKDFSSVTLLGK